MDRTVSIFLWVRAAHGAGAAVTATLHSGVVRGWAARETSMEYDE